MSKRVYLSVGRPEGYEDVNDDIIRDDLISNPEGWEISIEHDLPEQISDLESRLSISEAGAAELRQVVEWAFKHARELNESAGGVNLENLCRQALASTAGQDLLDELESMRSRRDSLEQELHQAKAEWHEETKRAKEAAKTHDELERLRALHAKIEAALKAVESR